MNMYPSLLLLLTLFSCCGGLKILKTVEPSCTVVTDEGNLDLSSIAGKDKPAFSASLPPDQGSGDLYWNPCNDVPMTGCEETGELFIVEAEGRRVEPSIPSCNPLGKKSQASFEVLAKTNLALNYNLDSGPFVILLDCDTTSSTNTLSLPQEQADHNAKLSGSGACIAKSVSTTTAPSTGKLSGGSILLIIVSVGIICYIIVGIVIMKYVRKAEGKDLIPNRAFWTALPGYTKDGVLFVVRCGKTTSNYDSI